MLTMGGNEMIKCNYNFFIFLPVSNFTNPAVTGLTKVDDNSLLTVPMVTNPYFLLVHELLF